MKNQNSRIYLRKFLEDFGKRSTIYVPIVEAITNSIESIERNNEKIGDGEIHITISRTTALPDFQANAKIQQIVIEDDGVGFTKENRDSFNTLYSSLKNSSGGKGLGRMFYIKYFKDVSIESAFKEDDKYYIRRFRFGREYEIIEEEAVEESEDPILTGAKVILSDCDDKIEFNDDIDHFAHRILERILNYFAVEGYICPQISIHDGDREIILNKLVGADEYSAIQLKNRSTISLEGNTFHYSMFELCGVYTQKSKIILTANNKSVTEAKLEDYIPEFATDFIKKDDNDKEHKFIVRLYVYGEYLDSNVNNERSDFRFDDHANLSYKIGKIDIEKKIADEARSLLGEEVQTRFEKKKNRVKEYVEENIWYKNYFEFVDFENLKMNLTDTDIEAELHKVKFKKDSERKAKVANVCRNLVVKDFKLENEIQKLIGDITETDRSNLAEYLSFRKSVLMLFEKALEWDADGEFEKEKTLHNIIFPVKQDSDNTAYEEHNLWIIDERLNFVTYLSSDQSTFIESADRPDISAFHHSISYREGEGACNPVSIFEFKRPNRTDFIRNSSNEDPIGQIVRYVNQFRDGKIKQPNGRNIDIGDNTPFYGYIIASADGDVKKWLMNEKDMKVMPDGEGWFRNFDNINLHIEFVTWDKLLKDANIRHRTFFEKLGLSS